MTLTTSNPTIYSKNTTMSNPTIYRKNTTTSKTIFTLSRLAMNGGQVHDPKLSTRGRPALYYLDEYLVGHRNNDLNDDIDESYALYLANETRGSLVLVSKSINSGLGATSPTW